MKILLVLFIIYLIESEILMEERKAEYFAALMLLGNLMPYFEGLKDMEFQAKAFQCMNAFQAPYKAVLISLYESAVKNGNFLVDPMRLSSKEQKNLQKNKPYKGFSRFRTDLNLVGLTCALYVLFLIMIMLHGHPFCYAAD